MTIGPRVLWRISNFETLDGIGGLRVSGRWHTRGRPVLYCAEHPAGALTEMLVHMDRDDMPATFRLLRLEIGEPHAMEQIAPETLNANWREDIAYTQAIGGAWLERRSSLLLQVPSALVPYSFNVLVNPQHPDIAKARIVSAESVPVDARFA